MPEILPKLYSTILTRKRSKFSMPILLPNSPLTNTQTPNHQQYFYVSPISKYYLNQITVYHWLRKLFEKFQHQIKLYQSFFLSV